MRKKKAKSKNEKPAQKIELSPLLVIAAVLAAIGKPFYFIVSRTILFVISLIVAGGIFFESGIRKKKKKPRKVHKVIFQRFSFPKLPSFKITFPKIKLTTPSILKIGGLKAALFGIKIRKKIKSFSKKFIKRPKVGALLFLFILLLGLLYLYFAVFKDLPSPKELTKREPEVATKIYDRKGRLLYNIYKDKNRTIIPLTEIPNHVRLATLAAEDAEFYNHPGFSIKGILRAVSQNVKRRSLQGGSTITQQLVKNVLLSPERTLTRKLKELILSIQVETSYTKDQILEMYLNEVSYGGTAYGIESASESYFGKNVGDLSLAEAAFLAGLPKSPTLYSPFGQNPETAFERQREILHLMRVNKFISEEVEEVAMNERIKLSPKRTEIKAPHFVMYVRQLLVDKYGEDLVEKGGLEVTTSLDLDIQEMAEKTVKEEVDKLKSLNVGNGAALVLNPETGEILAMVGSKNYFDIAGDGQVNVTLRLRQPGSSIKLINYAYALSNGYSPASIIDDSPITYVTPGSPPYSPVNYDGQFRGKVSLRVAFAESRNIPAVKILASYGVQKMIDQGQKMGITTWNDSSDYGLSLTLGGGAVKALDLARAYAVVANEGSKPDIMPILEVKNYKGKVLDKYSPQEVPILDNRVSFLITDILKDNQARSGEFGLNSYLVVRNHPEVAVKTGTSNDLRDNWTVGYNQNYLVLTWVGNNDNSPMSRIASGVTGASPIWNKIMSALLNDAPSIDWKVPDGVSKINICQITGTLPCDGCPTRQEWFLDEKKPQKACKPDKINPSPTPDTSRILENSASTKYRRRQIL